MKKIVYSVLTLILTWPIFALAWVEPTTVPPGNNIFSPLNSSAFGQSKVGGLILNLGNAAHGLIVRYGLVGIGTDNPQAALDVVGKVRSTGLEVNSKTEGALLPRMTTVERDAIAAKVEGLLIYNTDTKQLEVYADGAWKASSGGGDTLPKGTISFFNLSTCPSGWTEKTELKGRYPIGLPNSGTLGQSVGTALTNGENRSVGQHTHTASQTPHDHEYAVPCRWCGGPSNYWSLASVNDGVFWLNRTSLTAPTVSVANSGLVAGTNAPYLQLLACEKQTAGSSSGGGSSPSCTPCQISKMTTAERDALSNPEPGLEIFNTDTKTKNLFNGAEWTEIASIIPGLVGRWNMDEPSGILVADSSGRGNNGSVIGTTIVDGKLGRARSFNGSSDKVVVGNESFFDWERAQPFSISAWIKTSSNVTQGIIDKGYLWEPGWDLSSSTAENDGKAYFSICAPAVVCLTVRTKIPVADGSWHHLSATYDGSGQSSGVALYLDGKGEWDSLRPGPLTGSMLNNYNVNIGYTFGWNRYFNGLIDEVKIYNIALTPEQIKANYENTK